MASEMHNSLISHFRNRQSIKKNRNYNIQSIVKQTMHKKNIQEDVLSPLQDFLRNEEHVAAEAYPLEFRILPRDLKVYFPGPPQPPPELKEIPYTYQMVPLVPYKIPRQRKGTVGQWVLQDSGFIEKRSYAASEHKITDKQIHTHQMLGQKKKIFQKAVKNLAIRMRENNLSLKEIEKNKGFIKKSHNYYNSKQFFALVKAGDKEAQKLLDFNPYLAFDIDEFKMTALHWTARQGHPYLTKILLQKYRSNSGAKDMYGRTPLYLAVMKKHIPCIVRIFIQGGKLNVTDNAKQTIKEVAPDAYTKYLLQKLEEVKFITRAKGLKDVSVYRKQLQTHVKYILDESSLYF